MIRSLPFLRLPAVVLVLAAVYCGIWFYEASRVRSEVADFIAARTTKGMKITADALDVAGFPFRIEARFTNLVVDGLPYRTDAHVETPLLVARARPWRPGEWRLQAVHGLSLTLPQHGGELISASVANAKGRVVYQRGEVGSLTIEIDTHGLSVHAQGEALGAQHVSLRFVLPNKAAEDHTVESLGFSAVVDEATLPSGVGPMGVSLQHLTVDSAVEGPVPDTSLPAALAAWRDEGGTIEVHQLNVQWGTIALVGGGTLALDQAMQPLGAFSAQVRGWEAVLDSLAAAGTLTKPEANYARIGLTLLTRKAADGQSELKTAITLQNNQIYLGPARVAKFAHIDW
jgi:hypothetical protein